MPAKPKTPSTRPEWMIASGFGVGAMLAAVGVWAYVSVGQIADAEPNRPAWLAIAEVTPQLPDGAILQVQLQLRLDDQEAVSTLSAHAPAFQGLVIETAQGMTHHQLRGPQGMKRYGQAIKETVNDYLIEQHIPERVRQVAFEQMVLIP